MAPTATYYGDDSLSALLYDVLESGLIAAGESVCCGDVAFYAGLARQTAGPTLEIGAGTGRVAWALAEAGCGVVGVDLAPAMLARAEEKRRHYAAATAARVRFVRQDMTALDLGQRFGLIIAPYRCLNHLTDPADQRRTLAAMARHLTPDGRIVLHMLGPPLDALANGAPPAWPRTIRAPLTPDGHVMEWRVMHSAIDPAQQTVANLIRYAVIGPDRTILRESRETLTYRWSGRQEMRYLCELTGLTVEDLRDGFDAAAPAGREKEQIWLLRHAGG